MYARLFNINSNKKDTTQADNLRNLLDKLSSYESQIDLDQGKEYRKKITALGDVSWASFILNCTMAIFFLTNWWLKFGANSIRELRDPKTNLLLGWLDSNGRTTPFGHNLANHILQNEEIHGVTLRDINDNGIFNDAEDVAYTHFVNNAMRLGFQLAMLAFFLMIATFISKKIVTRNYERAITAPKTYNEIYQEVEMNNTAVEKAFDSLSIEDKQQLVSKGLAENNDGDITLKYICPITKCIITWLLAVELEDGRIIFYDAKFLLDHRDQNYRYNEEFRNPSTTEKIKRIYFPVEETKEFKEYLVNLSESPEIKNCMQQQQCRI